MWPTSRAKCTPWPSTTTTTTTATILIMLKPSMIEKNIADWPLFRNFSFKKVSIKVVLKNNFYATKVHFCWVLLIGIVIFNINLTWTGTTYIFGYLAQWQVAAYSVYLLVSDFSLGCPWTLYQNISRSSPLLPPIHHINNPNILLRTYWSNFSFFEPRYLIEHIFVWVIIFGVV